MFIKTLSDMIAFRYLHLVKSVNLAFTHIYPRRLFSRRRG